MTLLCVFAVTLIVAVLISPIAEQSVLSTAVLFLVAGFCAGRGFFGSISPIQAELLQRLAELALFSILFTDGMRLGSLGEHSRSWHYAGRALLIGMPLTIFGIAVLGFYLLPVAWPVAFLVAAVLSPTDPVFISAIFRFEGVPGRVKRLLNIESGLNDGLALPIVLLLLPLVNGSNEGTPFILLELLGGLALGIIVPWICIQLQRIRPFHAVGLFEPLNAFAIGLLVMALCYRTGANLFLAAFAAGITVVRCSSEAAESFRRFGELMAELLKLTVLLIFGAMIAPSLFTVLSGGDYLFVVVATFAVRPVAMAISLFGSGLKRSEILATGWFGPKGFASVVYGLLILQAGRGDLAHLIGLAVAASIIVFSSTDVLVGRWFDSQKAPPEPLLP